MFRHIFAAAACLVFVASVTQARDAVSADRIEEFARYAQHWCARGDAVGCRIAERMEALAVDLATAAPSCAEGVFDACLDAQVARREFWTGYGRLHLQPDMLPGPNGEPPLRPIWDQPAADEPPVFSPCDALRPECGFFGDPALGR